MMKFLLRAVFWMLATVAVLYLGDWAVWKVRTLRGGGIGHVEVGRMQVAALKGGKEEYYPDGTEIVDCSQSLFPQTGAGACWWVEGHRTVFER